MDLDELLNKADGLLSFKTPGSQSLNRRSKGRISPDLIPWTPYNQGSLGPRVDLNTCFWNWGDIKLKEKVVHLYEPKTREEVTGYDETHSVVLHGHPVGVHCPHGLQCHLFPCTPTQPVYGFKEKWSYVYD